MNTRARIAAVSLGLLSAAMVVNTSEAGEILPLGFRFTDNYHTTDVAGLQGEAKTTPSYGRSYALFGFELTERKNRTCSLTALQEHIEDEVDDRVETTVHQCGSKGPNSKKKHTAWEDLHVSPGKGAVYFAKSMKLCFNKEGTMVKGIRMYGIMLNSETGRLELPQPPGKSEGFTDAFIGNFGCPTPWKLEKECPAGSIAVGFVGHYAYSDPPRALTGIALKCRYLEFVDQNGRRPVS